MQNMPGRYQERGSGGRVILSCVNIALPGPLLHHMDGQTPCPFGDAGPPTVVDRVPPTACLATEGLQPLQRVTHQIAAGGPLAGLDGLAVVVPTRRCCLQNLGGQTWIAISMTETTNASFPSSAMQAIRGYTDKATPQEAPFRITTRQWSVSCVTATISCPSFAALAGTFLAPCSSRSTDRTCPRLILARAIFVLT